MTLSTAVAERLSIEEICRDRDHAVRLVADAYKLLGQADSIMRQLGTYCGLSRDVKPAYGVESARKEIDRNLWRAALERTGITQIMDHQARQDFEREVEKDPPEFTIENVRSQFITMSQVAGEMFARGVYNIFRRLDRNAYRTNEREPFRVGEKIIIGYIFCEVWRGSKLTINYRSRDTLNDLDRVFATLADRKFIAHSLATQIEHALNQGETEFSNYYMRIKGFKNGNAHIWFTDPDLLEKVNDVIAEYCGGNALAGSKGWY